MGIYRMVDGKEAMIDQASGEEEKEKANVGESFDIIGRLRLLCILGRVAPSDLQVLPADRPKGMVISYGNRLWIDCNICCDDLCGRKGETTSPQVQENRLFNIHIYPGSRIAKCEVDSEL
ncbi:hypothetical protein MLD38_013633 [Melastoma candidum]|uniref:Uncharacterized protein n=1 Tax=Melastoma candidum TaxID=119954 RepID=A0ACB9R9T3_9MYRT|nr:hypothetical protein MLD38_013633 [Melastoma candidum]